MSKIKSIKLLFKMVYLVPTQYFFNTVRTERFLLLENVYFLIHFFFQKVGGPGVVKFHENCENTGKIIF